jgi:hypothetical protein
MSKLHHCFNSNPEKNKIRGECPFTKETKNKEQKVIQGC